MSKAIAVLLACAVTGCGRGPATSAAPAISTKSGRASLSAPGSTLVRASWGAGPGELGHRLPSEGAPEGPMSFAVDARGRAFVLDQVNARVQVYEGGALPHSIPLPRTTFQDVLVDGSGALTLLDRLGSKTVLFVDPTGHISAEVPLVGPGVAEGGGVTGVFRYDDGTWVEYEHGELIRVADTSGRPDSTRPRLPGRLSADGTRLIRAARTTPTTPAVFSSRVGSATAKLAMFGSANQGMTEARIRALDSDLGGAYLSSQTWCRSGLRRRSTP